MMKVEEEVEVKVGVETEEFRREDATRRDAHIPA
jgi:hypothetical protein